MKFFGKNTDEAGTTNPVDSGSDTNNYGLAERDLANEHKSWWERSWPALACGAGLFSDGYINNVIAFSAIDLSQC